MDAAAYMQYTQIWHVALHLQLKSKNLPPAIIMPTAADMVPPVPAILPTPRTPHPL
jgi:hypothetical protein